MLCIFMKCFVMKDMFKIVQLNLVSLYIYTVSEILAHCEVINGDICVIVYVVVRQWRNQGRPNLFYGKYSQ